MTNPEILKLFIQKEVKQVSQEFLADTMCYLEKEKKGEVIKTLLYSFENVLQNCKRKGKLPDIRYIQLSLKRAKALKLEPFYQLELFDDQFILNEVIESDEVDFDWIYEEYRLYCEKIDQQSKRYFQQIENSALTRIKLAQLITCNKIVKHILVEGIVHIINLDIFQEMPLEQGIQIQIGEYRGAYQIVFTSDQYTKKIGKLWYGIL